MNKYAILVGAVLAVMVGMGLVMPAIALLNATGALPGFEVALLLLGLVLTGSGIGAGVWGMKRRAV